MARKQPPTQEQIADVKDAFRNVVRERDHLLSVMADRNHEIARLQREIGPLRERQSASVTPKAPFNLNERVWIREALRVYIGTPAFDNDPEGVAQMGALLHKVVKDVL